MTLADQRACERGDAARRASILLIDEHPATVCELLSELGQTIEAVSSVEAALSRIAAEEFAVILIGLRESGGIGFDAARRIRDHEQPRPCRTPIIYLSDRPVEPSSLEQAYATGAVDILEEPIVPLVLQAKVRGFVDLFTATNKGAEEAELLRLLVHGTVDYAIFMLDPAGCILTWNSGAARLKGYEAGEIIGRHFSTFYPEEAVQRGWPAYELEVAAKVGRFEDEGWRVRKDGSLFWANVVITALRDDAGQLRGFSKVTRDLTNRKHAEEALRQSEERFRLLVEGAKDYAIFLLDPEGRIASWNTGAERIKQYRADEIIGQHFSQFYPQEAIDRKWPEYELQMARATGRFEDEGWRIRKDGSQFWANVVITALHDQNGVLRGFSKITRDMTERKLAEENARRLIEEATARRLAEANARSLHDERERLRVTLASIGDAVISTDAEGRVNFLNAVAQELVGWSPSEASGHDLAEVFAIVNETTRHPVENPAMRALREGKIVGLANHTILISRDGKEIPIDDSAAPIRDSDDAVIGSVLVFRDISLRKRAEKYRTVRLAVTQSLAEAGQASEGVQAVMRSFCEQLGWEVGLFWTVHESGEQLVCQTSWHREGADVESFESASHARTFRRGEGLPGRVWEAGAPHWIRDVLKDDNFPRVGYAAHNTLRTAFASPVVVNDQTIGVIEFLTTKIQETDPELLETTGTIAGYVGQFLERRRAEEERERQAVTAETLYRIGRLLSAELDLHRLVQIVTDEGTRLTGAQFGAFFYNAVTERGETYTLYTLSGIAREAFSDFPMPRNTALFGPTFRGEGIVRVDDVTQDPRYGHNAPNHGMPTGHPPVRSYLAVPVVSRNGEVLGGLFFGHEQAGLFTSHHERLLAAVAGQAAIAIDNARLYQNAQSTAERLNLALAAANLGDWSWDAESDIVTLSERAAEVFGITPGPQMTWSDMLPMLHAADRERARLEVERAVAEHVQYDMEYRVNRPDGAQVWVAAIGRAIYDGSGKLVGMFGVLSDITIHKRLEESLQESEARFRGLMEQAPFSVQVFSPDGRTLSVNRAWEELWGLRLDQIQDYNLLQDPQLETKGVLSYLQRAFAGEPTEIPAILYDVEETLPQRSRNRDSRRWVAAVAYPLKDDAGQVREVVLVHDDITERKRTEQALQESQELYRAIGESIDYGVWVCDPHGRNTYASESFLRLVGLTQQECSDFGWGAVLHPDDAERTIAAWKECVQRGGTWDIEHRFRGVDGQWHYVLARGLPVRNERGEIIAWAGINLDIQRLKQVEEELRAADRRKDEFLATLAHELRNPLAPIRNSLQILKMPRVDVETARQTRDMMERQVHHLVRLVDDLLDVSRVMRGKIELRREPVEMASVIARAVETAQPLIEVQGHRLEISLPTDSLLLDADPVRLAQVVSNLLTNSAKYTESNGHIWLTARQEGQHAVLSVRDDGIGIARDMLPHVFDLFVQADHASTKAQGGLGIGLTLVKNLVEMHGGRVAARSAGLGKGAEFLVHLPLLSQQRAPQPSAGAASDQESQAPTGHRLLVVDDNQDAAVSLALLLRLHGHDVHVAHDGPSAVELAKAVRPRMIFLDIGMPVVDGYEVARRLRTIPELQKTRLIALTGWGQQEDRRRTAEAGFDHHLVKPPEPTVIKGLLDQLDLA